MTKRIFNLLSDGNNAPELNEPTGEQDKRLFNKEDMIDLVKFTRTADIDKYWKWSNHGQKEWDDDKLYKGFITQKESGIYTGKIWKMI